MASAKLLLVHPGASHSTADVYDGYAEAFRELGHRVIGYPLDAMLDRSVGWLNYAWRQQRKADPDIIRPSWADQVYLAGQGVLERALRLQVDAVVVVSSMFLHPDWLILLKRAGVKTVLILTESPYDDPFQSRVAGMVDVCFTNERTSVPYLRAANPQTHYLGCAYNPERSRVAPVDPDIPAHDALFVGTLFQERVDLLAGVDWAGLDFAIYGSHSLLPSRHRLRRYVRGDVIPNDQVQAYYRAAKVNINCYRTSVGFGRGVEHIAHAESLNPRALELAACGAFQLSEYRAEVEEVFGWLVPTYTAGDSAELGSLIRYFLSQEGERRERANALPAAVTGHTYAARARQLLATLAAAWSPRTRGYDGGESCAASD